ncbi:MAG TPA: D-alanine--D-alanine ligase family protein [bacterium]|nr:D-alanine--D-alanine ligase family protein [bacterium]HPO07362.1 D-alanine--D-alanine ligase family protein [bacterium]HQO34185.1 D-alanine--D-alanine ligase family protein [bacterium]
MNVKERIQIGLIYGGRSAEREVSYLSARAVASHLNPDRYSVYPIAISPTGRWMLVPPREELPHPEHLERRLLGGTSGETLPVPSPQCASDGRERPPLDVLFPLVHGACGEDGSMQGFFDVCELPYVGAGVAGSAIGMDKLLMKDILSVHGIPVGPYRSIRRVDWETDSDRVVRTVQEQFPYPVFAKPARTGSSVGISKAKNERDLREALAAAARYDSMLIVEKGMPVRELECGVIGNWDPEVTVVGEVIPEREFYDYHSKYLSDGTAIRIPADIPENLAEEARDLARRAFLALRCSGYARVDLFLNTAENRLYLNEINTIPGFTSHSMFPMLWEASGVSFSELLDRLVNYAFERRADEQRNTFEVPEPGVAPPPKD